MNLVEQVLIGAGAWSWAFFSHFSPPTTPSSCLAQMRAACSAGTDWELYAAGTMMQWTLNAPPYNSSFARTSPLPSPDRDIGFFLTVRGPHWWLGYGWVGCSVPYDFPDALRADVGVPLGTCAETGAGSGVFKRPWSKATSTVDCNSNTAFVEML